MIVPELTTFRGSATPEQIRSLAEQIAWNFTTADGVTITPESTYYLLLPRSVKPATFSAAAWYEIVRTKLEYAITHRQNWIDIALYSTYESAKTALINRTKENAERYQMFAEREKGFLNELLTQHPKPAGI